MLRLRQWGEELSKTTGGGTLTVDELAKLLTKYPPGLRVVVSGYENGYDDLTPKQVSMVRIELNTSKNRWEGQHEDAVSQAEGGSGGTDVVEALVLRRVSN